MFEKYPDRVAAVKWAWSVGGGKRLVGGDWIFTDEQLDRLRFDYDALAARLAEVRAAYSRYLAMTDAHLDSLSARLTDAERLLTAWHLAYHSGAGKEGIDDDTTTWLAGITVSADEVQR